MHLKSILMTVRTKFETQPEKTLLRKHQYHSSVLPIRHNRILGVLVASVYTNLLNVNIRYETAVGRGLSVDRAWADCPTSYVGLIEQEFYKSFIIVPLNDTNSVFLLWVACYKFVTVFPMFKIFLPPIQTVYKSREIYDLYQVKEYLFITYFCNCMFGS
jgi:hypothetical protein